MAVNLECLLEKTQVLHPNEVEDQTCPICLEDYLQASSREFPRRLPCGHTIGTECLLRCASSQAHQPTFTCPWCRNPIIPSVDARHLLSVTAALAAAAFARIADRTERAIAAANRTLMERGWTLISLVVAAALPGLYHNGFKACIPLGLLYPCLSDAIRRQLRGCPLRGAALVLLGYCTGTFANPHVGRLLVRVGKIPFDDAIKRAYWEHAWLVLGATLFLYWAQVAWGYPAGEMMAGEAAGEFADCLLYLVLPRVLP